ncbi:dentin sialophosphoprotein-like isoform X5 [Cydia pomonella]|uniref:dentin sialophosphoprotein-like isoform X5 n=1 Tax=Cydia pomonella TaxID=82600 RepID=UPI002ADE81BF|nr:dentin sialophosphoprotein-like isoform X5 [Cydia pomonella]
MKCVIFSMLLAVALALPAPKPDDDDNNPQNQNHPDSRRSLVPLFNSRSLSKASSDREDDDDDNSTYEKYARSNSDREDDDDDNNDESYSRSSSSKRSDSDREDDENSTYESSQRVAELSSYLDYLNDKYEGQGVLKVEYTPSSKKFNKYTRTHNLGSLHFSYHPPDKSYRAKNYKNYFVYSPSGKVQGSYGSSSYKSKFQPFESYKSDESSSSEYEPYFKSKNDFKPYFSSDFSPYKSRSFKKSLFSKSNSQDNFDDDSN